jgi:hypothetical protein
MPQKKHTPQKKHATEETLKETLKELGLSQEGTCHSG